MKKFFTTALLLTMVLRVMASQIEMKEAQATAQRFFDGQISSQRFSAHSSPQMRLIHTEVNVSRSNQPVYYVFNSDAGFVIVSGDDHAREILAYGDSPIDMAQIPENMKFWLSMYKQEIEYLQSHPDEPVTGPKDKLKTSGRSFNMLSINPMLSARWNQDAPFNKLCPVLPNGYHSLTGCSATSLSMILHHWKYPVDSIPEVPGYAYMSNSGWLELQTLPSIRFDWDNMLDVYTDGGYTVEQADAVAMLMRHVGQAEKTSYMTNGSSANDDNIFEAVKFFGYDEGVNKVIKAIPDYYGYEEELINDEDWAAMLQNELLEHRPVLYLAYTRIETQDISIGIRGHAFCVDGYDAVSDTYHVNWGWGGAADGYFALNAFKGHSQLYNIGQSMIIGIEPPVTIPTIKVPPLVGVESYVNDQATTTFNVNGRLLDGDVTLTLNDVNGVFALDATTISATEVMAGKTVTVTYTPKDLGTHTASVVLSSHGVADTTIILQGTSILEVYPPVLVPIDSSHVNMTAFRADWTDRTVDENIESYTLEVSTNPSVMLLSSSDFSDYPDIIGNLASDVGQYIPEGWTYDGGGFWLDGGCIEICPGSTLTSGSLDLSLYDKVTVVVSAKNWSDYQKAKLTISTSAASEKVMLGNNYDEYYIVLDCNSIDSISFAAGIYYSGYYIMIQKIEIYAGELEKPGLRGVSEEGDAEYRLVTDITDKNYTVDGLSPGGTFFYKVKARYIDGSESPWSLAQMVTLFDKNHQFVSGDVNHDGFVDISDVTSMINYLLTANNEVCSICGDVNHDGILDISDVTALINILLNGR